MSFKSKKANPTPDKVNGKAPKHAIRRMTIEPADNGGFISRTSKNGPKGHEWDGDDTTAVHPHVNSLAAHVKNTFGGPKASVGSKGGAAWSGIASKMLGS